MKSAFKTIFIFSVIAVSLPFIATGADFYVDTAGGDDGASGANWGSAFATITRAMTACSGTSSDVIHVAAGTYHESVTFKSNVTMLGGYPSGGGERDYSANTTALDGQGTHRLLTFVSASDCEIDGFILQHGHSSDGGAIYGNHSTPRFAHCLISNSSAVNGAGGYFDGSDPEFSNCRFVDNDATGDGGCLYCDGSSPLFWDTAIVSNTAGGCGGGVFFDNSASSEFTNCLIIENEAGEHGGGLYCDSASPTIINSTFSLNVAGGLGGAIYLGSKCYPVVINSILWGDSDDEIFGAEEKKNDLTITFSNVQQEGYGNPDDTCLPDENDNICCEPEFRERGEETQHDGYFLDEVQSPSVNTGDTEENPYGGSSNETFTTQTAGYRDMTTGDDVDMGYHYNADDDVSYIRLISFEAIGGDGAIVVEWETAAEVDNAGFVLFRTKADVAEFEQVTGLIPAEGSVSRGASYSFADRDVSLGVRYMYYLVDVDTRGTWTAHGPARGICHPSWLLLEAATRVRGHDAIIR